MPVRTQQLDSDDGFTLVEVIVAMLIFTIILTGFLYTMTASLTSTRDTRARVVAANLASQQIDVLRSAGSAFDVTDSSRDIELNGDTFHVKVLTDWITTAGVAASCEAGATIASLAYNHVTVEVTWDNMREGARPVYSDTNLTPRTKINDPTLGTVLVGVINAAGTAVAGAKVSLTPSGGVAAATTDGDGCAYLLKVPPGDYTVTVSKADHVNEQQVAAPTAAVKVTAGGASRISFAYDLATKYNVAYAPGLPSDVHIPDKLTTSFLSSYGSFPMPSGTPSRAKTFSLFPVASGYSILAGHYAETPANPITHCLSPDPGQWHQEPTKVGQRPDAVAGAPGAVVNVAVPMVEVRLSGIKGSGNHLRAVYVPGGAGDPGCGVDTIYSFGSVISSNAVKIALPYGSWELYRGNSTSQTTRIENGISVPTNGSVNATTGVVLLDPRVAP